MDNPNLPLSIVSKKGDQTVLIPDVYATIIAALRCRKLHPNITDSDLADHICSTLHSVMATNDVIIDCYENDMHYRRLE